MKKIIIMLIILMICVTVIFLSGKKENKKQKIKVAEVTHSIFYAPQYVAHSLGYFKEEGLDVEIILTPGADKVASSVISGDVEIGLCGLEQTIYVYNSGAKDYLVNFAALTKKDGSFLISRKKDFKMEDLKHSHIIAGRKGGMPAMTLEWILNQNKIETKDVTFDTSIDFASTSGAFIKGIGDYVSLFEPTALSLEKQGYGYVVMSLGELSGEVPYTAYHAKKSYIENNKEVIKGFNKAIDKGLQYVKNHTKEEVADAILSYFPDISYNDLTQIIERYQKIDAWYPNTFISEDAYLHMEEIMKNAKELEKEVPYNKLVDTTYMYHE